MLAGVGRSQWRRWPWSSRSPCRSIGVHVPTQTEVHPHSLDPDVLQQLQLHDDAETTPSILSVGKPPVLPVLEPFRSLRPVTAETATPELVTHSKQATPRITESDTTELDEVVLLSRSTPPRPLSLLPVMNSDELPINFDEMSDEQLYALIQSAASDGMVGQAVTPHRPQYQLQRSQPPPQQQQQQQQQQYSDSISHPSWSSPRAASSTDGPLSLSDAEYSDLPTQSTSESSDSVSQAPMIPPIPPPRYARFQPAPSPTNQLHIAQSDLAVPLSPPPRPIPSLPINFDELSDEQLFALIQSATPGSVGMVGQAVTPHRPQYQLQRSQPPPQQQQQYQQQQQVRLGQLVDNYSLSFSKSGASTVEPLYALNAGLNKLTKQSTSKSDSVGQVRLAPPIPPRSARLSDSLSKVRSYDTAMHLKSPSDATWFDIARSLHPTPHSKHPASRISWTTPELVSAWSIQPSGPEVRHSDNQHAPSGL